jgi:hypothetical protein
MLLDVQSAPTNTFRLAPVEHSHAPLFGFALVTLSCALASFALACATPFADFAVLAAAMMPLRPALLVVAGAWLVNQAIGFGALHYPIDTSTILWGVTIGAAALVVTLVSALVLRALPRVRTPLALAITLIGAYGVYELAIFAATAFLGGEGSFTAAITGRLGLLNLSWLIGLVAVCEIARLLNSARRDPARLRWAK